MKSYTLKSIAQRGTMLGAAFVVAASAFTPFAPAAFADALNPLTDRSLTLSSSAPGWDYLDGSGNTTYAPPNSGANGQKTGNYFKFKVSSSATVKTMSFQYCTDSAGNCLAPGDNGWTGSAPSASRNADTTTTSDLNITNNSAFEIGDVANHAGDGAQAGDFANIVSTTTGEVQAIPGADIAGSNGGTTPGNSIPGNFVVYYNNAGTWTQSTGWNLSVHNVENGTPGDANGTGKNNYMILTNSTGQALTAGQEVRVLFFASDNDFYITNPGSSWFFVKINTYNKEYDDTILDPEDDTATATGLHGLAPESEANIIDGGVTVANVMNHSIRIQTKVLETMQFSVGTVDPNSLASDDGDATPGNEQPSELETALGVNLGGVTPHTPCDPILGGMNPSDPVNVLSMGDPNAENSLQIDGSYYTHSFWRLSSNSSAGATVYYSGNTLSNTVGDEIAEIGAAKKVAQVGSEQFGLAMAVNPNAGNSDESAGGAGLPPVGTRLYSTDYGVHATHEQGADDAATTRGVDDSTTTDVGGNGSWHTPRLWPLVPEANYNEGASTEAAPKFAFTSSSTLIPVPIASQNTQVVDCVTGKMRYVANIAATTPAGIYTTAINYIAAPQY